MERGEWRQQMRDARQARRAARCESAPARGAVIGVAIICIGLLLLLANMGIIPFRNIWDFAPLVLVAIGALRLVDAQGNTAGSVFGGIFIAAGGLWFASNMDWFHVDHRIIIPTIVMAIGVLFLVKAIDRQRFPVTANAADLAGVLNEWALFGGIKRNIATQEFHGGTMFTMFGGIEIDLRRSVMASEEAVLDANAIFGGIELHVPPTWTIIVRGQSIFGGYEDKTLPASNPQDRPQRLILTGMALFGGVSIGN